MTTINIQEIEDDISLLKEKRLEIIKLQDSLEEAKFEYDELYQAFINDPRHAQIVRIVSEVQLLNDIGGNDDISAKLFPVDEPLEKADVVENWEAKDVPHDDEPAAIDAGCLPDGVSDEPSYTPTGGHENATPGLSNESEGAAVGNEADDATNPIQGGLV